MNMDGIFVSSFAENAKMKMILFSKASVYRRDYGGVGDNWEKSLQLYTVKNTEDSLKLCYQIKKNVKTPIKKPSINIKYRFKPSFKHMARDFCFQQPNLFLFFIFFFGFFFTHLSENEFRTTSTKTPHFTSIIENLFSSKRNKSQRFFVFFFCYNELLVSSNPIESVWQCEVVRRTHCALVLCTKEEKKIVFWFANFVLYFFFSFRK